MFNECARLTHALEESFDAKMSDVDITFLMTSPDWTRKDKVWLVECRSWSVSFDHVLLGWARVFQQPTAL